MKTIPGFLALAFLASTCSAHCAESDNLDGKVRIFRDQIVNIDHIDFEQWKELRTKWSDLFEDVKRVPKDLLPETARVGEKLQSLLLNNFKDAVENRDIEEASDIFTYFGSVPMKAHLAGVLAECEDSGFVARIVHRELAPKAWSKEEINNHVIYSRPNPESYRALSTLYYDKLLKEAAEPNTPLGSFYEEKVRPYRLRLERKYPFLAETVAETGTRDSNQPPPPPDKSSPRPAANPDAQDNSPKNHPSTPSFPWLPAALAAAFLLLAFLSWRVLRNRRSGRA